MSGTPLMTSSPDGWYVRAPGLPWTGPFASKGDALRFAYRLGFRDAEARQSRESP